MVQDVFKPNLQNSTFGDKLSDKFLGTNKVHNINMLNNYELQKAVNLNKYNWNKEGMISAGINPLISSGGLSGVSQSQAQSNQSGDAGYLGEFISSVIDELNPVKQIREMKSMVKSMFHIFKRV